jgi:hypothetical protein
MSSERPAQGRMLEEAELITGAGWQAGRHAGAVPFAGCGGRTRMAPWRSRVDRGGWTPCRSALMALAHARFVPFPRATRSRPPPPPQVDAALPAPRWQDGRSNRRNFLSCHSLECLLVCTHVRRPHVSPSYPHRRPGRRRSLLAAQGAALTPRQYTCTRRRWRTFRQSVASIRALRRKQLEDGGPQML